MNTTRLIIVLGRIASEDSLFIENILTQELDQLNSENLNLKEHFNNLVTGNFYVQGNTVISMSFNIETTIILNASKKSLTNVLHTLNTSSKCYLVYAGMTCPKTGDWYLQDDLLSNKDLVSFLSTLINFPEYFYITGVDARELWLDEIINLSENKKVFIKFRNTSLISDCKLKDLVHQLGITDLSTKLVFEKDNHVDILFKENLVSFVINKYKICISSDVSIIKNEQCQLYIATGETILPNELSNLPFTMTNEASSISNRTDRIIDFPKGTTMLHMQINVGHVDLHYFGDRDSKVFSIVWTPYMKKVKVVRLIFADGDDFIKFIDGVKQLLKDKLFHNVAGFSLDERVVKDFETSTFKLPLCPLKNLKSNSIKAQVGIAPHQKLDTTLTKLNTKDLRDSQQVRKIKTETKPSNIVNHKDKPDSAKEKMEINKIKSSAHTNAIKNEKIIQVKDKSIVSDKNIKSNQVVTKSESVKKTAKTDMTPTTSKHTSKEIFQLTKPTLTKEMINKSDASKKKVKSVDVAVSPINQDDAIQHLVEKVKGITNGVVDHLDMLSDQGINLTSTGLITSNTISNQDLISLLPPLSTEAINISDQICREVKIEKNVDELNTCENHIDHVNEVISLEASESLHVNGFNVELKDNEVNENIVYDFINMNDNPEMDENYKVDVSNANKLDGETLEVVKFAQFDEAKLDKMDFNISNNAIVQVDGAVGGSVLPNHGHINSNFDIADLDINEIAIQNDFDENEAPRSPGYKQFVHDYEVSILTEPEPIENFLENLESITGKIVDKLEPTYKSVSVDLNKVHDLSNISLDDEVVDDDDMLTKTNETKKKKVPTATLR